MLFSICSDHAFQLVPFLQRNDPLSLVTKRIPLVRPHDRARSAYERPRPRLLAQLPLACLRAQVLHDQHFQLPRLFLLPENLVPARRPPLMLPPSNRDLAPARARYPSCPLHTLLSAYPLSHLFRLYLQNSAMASNSRKLTSDGRRRARRVLRMRKRTHQTRRFPRG